MRYRLRTLLIVITAVCGVFAYLRTYTASSTTLGDFSGGGMIRVYETAWQAKVFKPAARLESVARGRPVHVAVWTSKSSRQFKLP